MICFSLSNPISQDKIIREISKLIENNIKSKEEAESYILTISLSKVSQVFDNNAQRITDAQTTKI